MKDGNPRIMKWQTGMTSLFFSVSPRLRVRQFFRVGLWVKVWSWFRLPDRQLMIFSDRGVFGHETAAGDL